MNDDQAFKFITSKNNIFMIFISLKKMDTVIFNLLAHGTLILIHGKTKIKYQ